VFFLLPIGVEGNEVRLPVVCIGILALCVLAFFGTWVIPDNPAGADPGELRETIKELEERPYLEVPSAFGDQSLSVAIRQQMAKERARWLESHPLPAPEVVEEQQAELNGHVELLIRSIEHSPMRRFGLVPSRGFKQIGFFTHMFLHFGWLHLLGNLLFFYLCGPLLEDTWGRKLFALFYVVGGLVAATAHFVIDRSSHSPMAGASGAIAACMGAFAVRFATRKIAIAYFFLLGFRFLRGIWHWPAWVCGLLWFGSEVLTALTKEGRSGGVAVMAHVGGFAFGAGIAFAMKAIGLEKQFVATSETSGALTVSLLSEVEQAHALLAQGDRIGARSLLEAGVKAHPEDVDAAIGLVRLDFEARDNLGAMARLEPLLNRLLRAKGEERAIALLWQVWPQLKLSELNAALAYALARAAESVGSQGEGLTEALFSRGGEAPGLMGAKSLLRAAELRLKTTEPHRARPLLEALLARADAGPELHERASALLGKVPAAPVLAQAMDSGLELSRESTSTGFRPERPPPKIVECALLELTSTGLTLQSRTGDKNALSFNKVLAVAAGVVPLVTEGAAPRGVLVVDLIVAWGDAESALVSIRLDSDSTAMSTLFPGTTAAEVYGAFFTQLLEASGASALGDAAELKSGKFPRFASPQARDLAVFSAV
jgi:membrane associated rhomboid family serine protease